MSTFSNQFPHFASGTRNLFFAVTVTSGNGLASHTSISGDAIGDVRVVFLLQRVRNTWSFLAKLGVRLLRRKLVDTTRVSILIHKLHLKTSVQGSYVLLKF